MPKPALGRGLGNLLEQAKPPAPEPAQGPAKLSPGMATLLRKGEGEEEAASQSAAAPSTVPASGVSRHKWLLRISLMLADVLLIALAVWLVLSSHGLLGALGWALCVTAFALGAWLSSLAVALD